MIWLKYLKIYLHTDLKIILLIIEIITHNIVKNFDFAISLNILHNYFQICI